MGAPGVWPARIHRLKQGTGLQATLGMEECVHSEVTTSANENAHRDMAELGELLLGAPFEHLQGYKEEEGHSRVMVGLVEERAVGGLLLCRKAMATWPRDKETCAERPE